VPTEQPPFFVVGVDRSGTTLLRLVLDRGDVAIPPESMFLADFASVRRAGGLEDPEAAAAFMERVWSHPRVRAWNLPGSPPQVPLGLTHEQAYRYAVEAPFRAYALAHGKDRWADKTPYYLEHLAELDAVWPDARFVVLVRDGRDVAVSLLRLPFGPNNVWAAARFWARGIRRGHDAAERYPDRTITVRYEDLCADPNAQADRLCRFLGLGFDESMLAIEETDPAKLDADKAAWFTGLKQGINASAVGRWRSELSPHDQALFSALAGPELEAAGYEPGAAQEPTAVASALYRAQDTALKAVNFVRLRLVAERGREVRYVLGRKLGRA
jgi:sulfotransferase family protein